MALFVCLLGQTMKITGGKLHQASVLPDPWVDSSSPRFYVVEYPTMVEIKLIGLVIIDCPPRLAVVGGELRWQGGERLCTTWLSSRYPFNGTCSTGLMTNKAL